MAEERRMLICEFCDAKVSPYPEPDRCPHCHKPITEVVEASKLKEQEERCEANEKFAVRIRGERIRLEETLQRLREFCTARFNIANNAITNEASAHAAGEREGFRCVLAAFPTDTPSRADASSVDDQLCVCGHTAHWHGYDGWGDCEHSQDCRCEGFTRVKDAESWTDENGETYSPLNQRERALLDGAARWQERCERLGGALSGAAAELQRAAEMLYKADWNYGESGKEMEEAATEARKWLARAELSQPSGEEG